MSNDGASMSEASQERDWRSFLLDEPIGAEKYVVGALNRSTSPMAIAGPELPIFCDGENCNAEMNCDCSFGAGVPPSNNHQRHILGYQCRHCLEIVKVYVIQFVELPGLRSGTKLKAAKIGEYPGKGIRVPARVQRLVQADRDLFLKGLKAESSGLGIGAFGYYRRVVERQKDELFDAVIRVARRVGSPSEMISNLEAAKKETQFSKAIDTVKDGIPESLRINGHNPLTLLHTATSRGLHNQSDEECLELATDIRLVLTEMAEKVAAVLKDHAELDSAVNRLMKPPKKPAS